MDSKKDWSLLGDAELVYAGKRSAEKSVQVTPFQGIQPLPVPTARSRDQVGRR